MIEEKLNALRHADNNLRDALKMDEAELPKMPADLNERLMKRMAVGQKSEKRRIVWPWIAAACVAGMMMIWLMPPKEETKDVVADNKQKVETPVVNEVKAPKTEVSKKDVKAVNTVRKTAVRSQRKLLAQKTVVSDPTPAVPTANEAHADIAMAEKPQKDTQPVILTERDIPITRPENYQYTPEELALLKKQADEAYLKWVQLELEISKNNLQQTAQQ